jgi:hypothetical protein
MATFSVQVEGETLKVDCGATLDVATVQALLAAVKESVTGARVAQAIVLTGRIEDVTEQVKRELVAFQRELSLGRRTAWVDERARFRGIALWIMHLAGDANGKAVSTMTQAEEWLRSNESREARGSKVVSR